MKKIIIGLAVLGILTMGCTGRQIGSTVGAITVGAIGMSIGGGDMWTWGGAGGALIGGAVGGYVGGEIGEEISECVKDDNCPTDREDNNDREGR
jgi:phage tail tape-measure protein